MTGAFDRTLPTRHPRPRAWTVTGRASAPTEATAPVRSVTVLICSWRRPHQLEEPLEGVAGQTRASDQVLVVARVDDATTREVIAAYDSPVEEVLVHRPGIVAARVAGLERATGDVVLYLDDDAVPHPDWIERTVAHYDADGRIGAVGGKDLLTYETEKVVGVGDRVGVITAYGRFVGLHHLGSGAARDVDFLKGVNMSFRRKVFPDLRPDPSLRGDGIEYFEETSIALAIQHARYRVVYDPAIKVDHNEGRRFGDQRGLPSGLALLNRARNRTYLFTTYLPAHRAVRYLLYSVLVGSREIPGIAITVRCLTQPGRTKAPARLATSLRGHLLGIVETRARARAAIKATQR